VDASCIDVLTQVFAASHALQSAALGNLLANALRHTHRRPRQRHRSF